MVNSDACLRPTTLVPHAAPHRVHRGGGGAHSLTRPSSTRYQFFSGCVGWIADHSETPCEKWYEARKHRKITAAVRAPPAPPPSV
jgi:hypothetical protein